MTDDLIREIEEGETRFDLAFASTTKTLLYRLTKSPLIQKARRAITQDPYLVCTLLNRAEILFARPVESGYLHPDDLALSIYLYLIGTSPDNDIQNFVHEIASSSNRSFRGSVGVAKYMQTKTPKTTVQPNENALDAFFVDKWKRLDKPYEDRPDLSFGRTPSEQSWPSVNQRRLILSGIGVA